MSGVIENQEIYLLNVNKLSQNNGRFQNVINVLKVEH